MLYLLYSGVSHLLLTSGEDGFLNLISVHGLFSFIYFDVLFNLYYLFIQINSLQHLSVTL